MGSNISKHISKNRRSRPKHPLPLPTSPVKISGRLNRYSQLRNLIPGRFLPSSFLRLPNELLLEIANHLDTARDLHALMHANRRLAFLLDHLLSDILLHTYQMSAKPAILFSAKTHYSNSLVLRLIRLGVDLNRFSCNCSGNTTYCRCMPPLYTAIVYSNETMVDSLLRHGARIDVPYGTDGDNAVHLAIQTTKLRSGYFEVPRKADLRILGMLLGGGRLQTMNDPASLNGIGLSWLNMAIRSCLRTNITIVEPFLSRGLCVDVADQERKLTPLHVAVLNNRVDLAALLLKLGADYNTIDSKGKTPFGTACNRPNCALIDLLLCCDATLIDTVVGEGGETAEACLERKIEQLLLNEEHESDYFLGEMRRRQEMLTKLKKLSEARRNSFLTKSLLQIYYNSL